MRKTAREKMPAIQALCNALGHTPFTNEELKRIDMLLKYNSEFRAEFLTDIRLLKAGPFINNVKALLAKTTKTYV